MDFFQRLGNLLSGQGWSSDKEVRKRRRREEQQPQISRQPTQNRIQNQVQNAFGLPSRPREDRRPDGMPTTSLDMSKIDRPKEPAQPKPKPAWQEEAEKRLKAPVKDVNNYYKSDADRLRRELARPNMNENRIRGITQSLDNRRKELTDFSSRSGASASPMVDQKRQGQQFLAFKENRGEPEKKPIMTGKFLAKSMDEFGKGVGDTLNQIKEDTAKSVVRGAPTIIRANPLLGGGLSPVANMLAERIDKDKEKIAKSSPWLFGNEKVGTPQKYGSDVLKGVGVDKPNPIAATAVGAGLTALDIAGLGVGGIGASRKNAVGDIGQELSKIPGAIRRQNAGRIRSEAGEVAGDLPTNSPKINAPKPENKLGAGISRVEPPAGSTRVRAGENAVEQAQNPPVQPRAAEVPVRQPEQPVVTPDTNIQVQNKVPEQQPINQKELEQDIKKTLEDLAVKTDAPKQVEVPKQGAVVKVPEKPKADELVLPQKVDTEPGQVAPIQAKDPQAIKTQEAIENMPSQTTGMPRGGKAMSVEKDPLEALKAEATPSAVDVNEGGRAAKNTPKPTKNAKQDLPKSIEIPRGGKVAKSESAEKVVKTMTPEEAKKAFANRFISMPDKTDDTKAGLAKAVGLKDDAKSDVGAILKDGGVTEKKATKITNLFNRLDEIVGERRDIQKGYRRNYVKGKDIDTDPSKVRSRLKREESQVMSKIQSEVNKLKIKGDKGERTVQALENVIRAKNTNQLLGAPVERGIFADIIGDVIYGMKNPIKMIRSATKHGNPASSAYGTVKKGWTTPPKTVSEGFKYIVGNPYRTAMLPAQTAADMRKGAFRTELTKWANKELKGKNMSNAEAEKLSRLAGDDMEALVNMGAGVDNGTVGIRQYRQALKQWKKFIQSGSKADHTAYIKTIENQNSLADAIAAGVSSEKYGRFGAALINGLLPYMRNAKNMTMKGITQDLNPFTQSLIDGIRRDQRGWAENLMLGVKNKTVDYSVLAALGSMLVYNPSDDADDQGKPPGVSIDLGGGNYFSIRATPLEFPLAAIQTAKEIVEDTTSGNIKDWQYYAGMMKSSIPYVDYLESHGDVVESLANIGGKYGDNAYAAKNFAVNQAKSLVPFSNNNLIASASRLDPDGDGSRSLNAKKSYDADPIKWFGNALTNNFGITPWGKRSDLEDSRDASGRVRTVNNQGAWMDKTINDENTKTYNKTITDLVKYGRDNGLGGGTKELFDTYNKGKNNNFKSVQDAITFLDADGNPKPADKLKQNKKLGGLAKQIRDGFYGDSGSDLLKIGDKTLKSDAAVLNKSGTKNTKLPISMQAIKNAIAATDLPEDKRNKMYSVSKKNTELYNQLKAKNITYDEYSAQKAENEKTYTSILTSSKNYKKMVGLFDKLDKSGFFKDGGLGSTKSGQTYLWNSLNALLADKGATPAANYPEDDKKKGWGSGNGWGRGRSGGSRSKALDTDFGMLDNMPNIQQYQTISSQAGEMPQIAVQRPRIVHKIGKSG